MSFLRHIGKQGDRNVAVLFREVPGEPHMCLVVYPQILNKHIHDPLMACIEGDIGQNSENLADALNRTYTTDGAVILQKLHTEGMIKKVTAESIIMTPAPNTRIKLNELNKILNEMKMGEDAVKRLSELDNSRGIQDPADVARRMRGNKDARIDPPTQPLVASSNDALGDMQLANSFKNQAAKMTAEANGLLAEANRLLEEANKLSPQPVQTVSKPTKVKKVKIVPTEVITPPAKSTRAKKANVA